MKPAGTVVTALLWLAACSQAPKPPAASAECAPHACETDVTATGWFHVVRNGAARFFLVADSAGSVELLLDEEPAAAYGGREALDRRRVSVSGVRVSATLFRVRSIRPVSPP